MFCYVSARLAVAERSGHGHRVSPHLDSGQLRLVYAEPSAPDRACLRDESEHKAEASPCDPQRCSAGGRSDSSAAGLGIVDR